MTLTRDLLSTYFLRKADKFEDFWTAYQQRNKKILYILGLGFDPRTLRCFEIIFRSKSCSTIDCMVIEYNDDFDSEPMLSFLKYNTENLENFIPKNDWKIIDIKKKLSTDNASVSLIQKLKKFEFSNYTDIIIDISAMPTSIYFPLIKTILKWIDCKKIKYNESTINLHVVVAENAKFDECIVTVGMDDKATYMYKFDKHLISEANSNLRNVWLPLLGRNKLKQLDIINQEIKTKKTYPIFPSPSSDPSRSTRLLLEYKEILFDGLDIDVRNFIYSNEENPFETFRQIYDSAVYYYKLFEEFKGCNIIVSPLSSKLLCLGSLLALYVLLNENKTIGVAYVENHTYDVDSSIDFDEVKNDSVPFTIWLTGEVYE